ncbi:UNVERIFIED_CONTAM: hypothetical protein RMT77_019768 [Armadillidium vulgare]
MEIIKLGKEMGLKGKELIDFFKEFQTRAEARAEAEKARAEAEKARAEAEKARAEARAKAAKQRELEYRLLKIRLGLVSEFDDSIEELHNESSKSADRVRKLEEENELKIELADPKQEKAVLPSISGSELPQQIISSWESPMKGENFSSQRELFVEREVSAFQDSSSLPYQEVIEVTSSFHTAAISTTNITTAATSEECSLVPASMLVNSHDVAFIEKMKDLEEMDSELIKETTSVRLEQSTLPPVIQKMEFLTKAITENKKKIDTIVSSDEQDLEINPVEAEENKVFIKSCRKLNVQVKLEEERTLKEGKASDNFVTPSDNYKQITEMVVIKSEVENSSQDGASIIKRRKLGAIQSKNPISTLNEFYPELKYKVINQLGPSHEPTFTVGLKLNDHHFEISIRNKKNEKYMTAQWTLRYLVQSRNENEMVQALKSNCPKRVEFTEDSSASNISSSSEFKESVQGASFNKQGKDISEGGKEQKTVSSQTTENLIVPFNHFGKSAKYGMLEKSNDSYSKTFKFSNIAGQQCFEETGSKMLLFKTVAAKETLSKLSDLVITPFMHLHYVSLTSHPNLHRPQNLADRIAKSVCEKFLSLTSEKPNLARRKNRIRKMRLYKYRRKGKIIIK